MHALLARARFLGGAVNPAGMPPDAGAEVAFAGRSNAGKSSALNVITGVGGLARTSKTPGRTQQINFFGLDDARRLVDLPGYGYAHVPVAVRERWERTTSRYLQRRRSLRGVVLVMDVRHPLTDSDRAFLGWCAEAALPVYVLLTKADKLGRGKASAALAAVRRYLDETVHGRPAGAVHGHPAGALHGHPAEAVHGHPAEAVHGHLAESGGAQLFSATARLGVDEARGWIVEWLGPGAPDQAKKIPG